MVSRGPTLAGAAVVAVLAAIVAWSANTWETKQHLKAHVIAITGGDPDRGREDLGRLPCGGCHVIPGIAGAKGKAGPPLTGFAGRAYIGGRLANSPDNLVDWIEDPHRTDPQSAMPPGGFGDREARDIAAYLYTLG